MWKLSIEDDQGQSTIVQLVRGEYSIGRTEDNTIRLTERNISRHHARLVKTDSSWCFEDQGSYNGCYINGARVVERHPIAPNDLIQLGDYRLELHADESACTPDLGTTQGTPESLATTVNLSTQADRLVMVVGPTPGREYHLTKGHQRIGRGEECELCVNHASVSRWHADLNFVGANRYELVDHGSSNGVRINGVELARGLLDNRDLVELGDIVLKFIPAGQVYRPTPEESRQLAALLGVDIEGPPPTKLEKFALVWHSMSRPTRLGAVALGLVVIVLFAFVVATRQKPSVPMRAVAEAPASPERLTLDEATKQLNLGNVEEAHRLVTSLGSASNLASDPAFQLVETRWADTLLSRAEQSPSPESRRSLLELVAKTVTVDPATRKKASDLLVQVPDDAVDVAQLPNKARATKPSGEPGINEPAPTAADVPSPVRTADSIATEEATAAPKMVRTPPTTTGSGTSNTTTVASRTAVPTTATTGTVTQRVALPSSAETSATELATSGKLDQSKSARDALKRKVAAGTATERERRLLRALCRQLKDSTCSR